MNNWVTGITSGLKSFHNTGQHPRWVARYRINTSGILRKSEMFDGHGFNHEATSKYNGSLASHMLSYNYLPTQDIIRLLRTLPSSERWRIRYHAPRSPGRRRNRCTAVVLSAVAGSTWETECLTAPPSCEPVLVMLRPGVPQSYLPPTNSILDTLPPVPRHRRPAQLGCVEDQIETAKSIRVNTPH